MYVSIVILYDLCHLLIIELPYPIFKNRHFLLSGITKLFITDTTTNRLFADSQIWEAKYPWFSEIYVCKIPQVGGGRVSISGPWTTRTCGLDVSVSNIALHGQYLLVALLCRYNFYAARKPHIYVCE